MLIFQYTPIGRMGVEVEGGKVVALWLPQIKAPPATRGVKPDALTQKAFAQIGGFLAGKRKAFDLPLEIRGTDFQKRVWQALCAIPYGQTASYGEIAQAIGQPKAARAVGMACNANPLPLVVPCHRVVAGGGRIGGFASGGGVKEKLLAVEGSLSALKPNLAPAVPAKSPSKPRPRYLHASPTAREHLAKADPKLAAAIAKIGPLGRRAVGGDVFASLIDSIVSQQISGYAAQAIGARLAKLWGNPTPRKLLKIPVEKLRACGLSQRKVEYILGATQAAVERRIDFEALWELDDAQVIEKLSSLRGIGVWTAQMLLLFTFGRTDVLSYLDLGIRNGLAKLHGPRAVASEKAFARYRKLYSPHGSVASLYLWQIADGE